MPEAISKFPKEFDISNEVERTYVYTTGAVTIKNPSKLFITESGSHRVVGKDGYCCRPEPGYLAINWIQSNGKSFDF